MFDFFKGLIVWSVKKFIFLLFPLVGWVVFFFENFPETVKSIWNYFISWLQWYFQDFYLWLFSKLSEMLTTFFAGNDFVVSVLGFSNDMFLGINFFIPLNELCSCVTLIVTTMISVFLIRIILKAVPTIW